MCNPVAAVAVGVGAMGAGAVMQSKAAGKQARLQQQAIDRQTAMTSAEFDRRQNLIGESDSRIDALTNRGFRESLDLRGESFYGSLGGEQARFNDLLDIEDEAAGQEYMGRSAGTKLNTALSMEGDRLMGDSFTERMGLSDAEQTRQAGFRGEADSLMSGSALTNAYDIFEDEQGKFALAGDTALRGAISEGGTPTFLSMLAPEVQAQITAQTGNSVGAVADDSTALADVAAYNPAATSLEQNILRTNEGLGVVDLKSQLSRGALGAEVGAAKLRGDNARAAASDRRGAVTAEVDSFLDTLRQERDGRINITNRYRDGLDAARDSAYSDKAEALDSFYTRNLGSENSFISALSDASQRFEDQNRQLTNFKVANTRVTSPLGSFLSQAGTIAAGAGASAALS
jgi:hypothetical protein